MLGHPLECPEEKRLRPQKNLSQQLLTTGQAGVLQNENSLLGRLSQGADGAWRHFLKVVRPWHSHLRAEAGRLAVIPAGGEGACGLLLRPLLLVKFWGQQGLAGVWDEDPRVCGD